MGIILGVPWFWDYSLRNQPLDGHTKARGGTRSSADCLACCWTGHSAAAKAVCWQAGMQDATDAGLS
jgi:hypothetical protein